MQRTRTFKLPWKFRRLSKIVRSTMKMIIVAVSKITASINFRSKISSVLTLLVMTNHLPPTKKKPQKYQFNLLLLMMIMITFLKSTLIRKIMKRRSRTRIKMSLADLASTLNLNMKETHVSAPSATACTSAATRLFQIPSLTSSSSCSSLQTLLYWQ